MRRLLLPLLLVILAIASNAMAQDQEGGYDPQGQVDVDTTGQNGPQDFGTSGTPTPPTTANCETKAPPPQDCLTRRELETLFYEQRQALRALDGRTDSASCKKREKIEKQYRQVCINLGKYASKSRVQKVEGRVTNIEKKLQKHDPGVHGKMLHKHEGYLWTLIKSVNRNKGDIAALNGRIEMLEKNPATLWTAIGVLFLFVLGGFAITAGQFRNRPIIVHK